MPKNNGVMTTRKTPRPGRPKSDTTKESVTIRLYPDLIAKLDAIAAAQYQTRSTVLELAAKAMLKRGYARTLEDAR